MAISKWGVYAFAMPGPCDSLPTLPGSPAHPPTRRPSRRPPPQTARCVGLLQRAHLAPAMI